MLIRREGNKSQEITAAAAVEMEAVGNVGRDHVMCPRVQLDGVPTCNVLPHMTITV